MTDAPPPPRFDVARALVWALVVALVATVLGAAWWLRDRAAATGPGEAARPTGLFPAAIGRWFDVPAVERSGRALGTQELLGRPLVVDFVFARCSGTCPPLQSAMQRLQAATKDAADVRLVSLTVDPARDDPEALRKWADALGADPERWLFLRIEDADLRRLMREGLKVPTADELVAHSNYFMLVDAGGAVRGRYEPLDDPDWLATLLADLDVLRAEARGR